MISIATSSRGEMRKRFPEGKAAVFSKGHVETVDCDSLESLRDILNGIKPKQALIAGHVTGTSVGEVTNIGTKLDCRDGETPRIKSRFTQSQIFLMDYDYCEEFPCRRAADVHKYLCKLMPQVFDGAGYLAKKSSSSTVLRGGKPIKGTSWHIYYIANDAFKIRFLANAIMESAESKGMIYQKLSSDGKLLRRTVIDLMPIKIGACGLVYEASPYVDGIEYTLVRSRIRIVSGGKASTSKLQDTKKQKVYKKKSVSIQTEGYFKKSRRLHYSGEYRNLSPAQVLTLDDIYMEYRGGNHGTKSNPIILSTRRFRARPNDCKKNLDALVMAGFIRYESGKAKRIQNRYYINFDLLYMAAPKGWKW